MCGGQDYMRTWILCCLRVCAMSGRAEGASCGSTSSLTDHVHVDCAGPFMGRMFLVMVDAHWKWPEVVSMSYNRSSQTIVVLRQVFSAFGLQQESTIHVSGICDILPGKCHQACQNCTITSCIKWLCRAFWRRQRRMAWFYLQGLATSCWHIGRHHMLLAMCPLVFCSRVGQRRFLSIHCHWPRISKGTAINSTYIRTESRFKVCKCPATPTGLSLLPKLSMACLPIAQHCTDGNLSSMKAMLGFVICCPAGLLRELAQREIQALLQMDQTWTVEPGPGGWAACSWQLLDERAQSTQEPFL